MIKEKLIYAIDFDGTIVEHAYPGIGMPIYNMLDIIKKLKEEGHSLILWTCRYGEKLEEAKDWLKAQGVYDCFDAFNENLPEQIKYFGSDTRKIFANVYVDDRAQYVRRFAEEFFSEVEEREAVDICITCRNFIFYGDEYFTYSDGPVVCNECMEGLKTNV